MFYEIDLDPEILDAGLPKRTPGETLPLWQQILNNKLRDADLAAEAEEATWD